jgi:hypothetical protein
MPHLAGLGVVNLSGHIPIRLLSVQLGHAVASLIDVIVGKIDHETNEPASKRSTATLDRVERSRVRRALRRSFLRTYFPTWDTDALLDAAEEFDGQMIVGCDGLFRSVWRHST